MSIDETPLERLEQLRAEVADLRTEETDSPVLLPVRPGDEIHALKSGLHVHTGGGFTASAHTTRAGETICLTAAMIDASRDRYGDSWMALIGDDNAQLQRWGEVRFRLGRAPEGIQTWNERGDSDWTEQRNAAKAEAWAMPTAEARAEALAAVERRFGPTVTTSVHWKHEDPSIKLAEAQQHALNTGGVRFSQHVVAKEAGAER